jgi:hypothetical protein
LSNVEFYQHWGAFLEAQFFPEARHEAKNKEYLYSIMIIEAKDTEIFVLYMVDVNYLDKFLLRALEQ